jgi:retron-type reverse transcriptase
MARDKWYTLYGHLLSFGRLKEAFYKVKKNKGAPGVDGVSIEEYENNLIENLEEIKYELKDKTYEPKLVKRVYIDKGNGEKRPLGIPTVKDRIVQRKGNYLV